MAYVLLRAPSAGVMETITLMTLLTGLPLPRSESLREDSHHPISQVKKKLEIREMPGLLKVAPAGSGEEAAWSLEAVDKLLNPLKQMVKRGAGPTVNRKRKLLAQTKVWENAILKKVCNV